MSHYWACCIASTALATPWGQQFQTDDKPNLVNLWISDTSSFLAATGLPADWIYWQSADGLWAQWYTEADYGQANVTATQNFGTPKATAFYLDVQEVHYNWDTGAVDAGINYALMWTGSAWSMLDAATEFGKYTDAVTDCPPPAVPEPATILLFGSGLVGLAVFGRKKLFKK